METATYTTSGFIRGSTLKWIIITSQASLFVMFVLLIFGLHPFIVVAAFIGSAFLGIGLVTGKATYTLDEGGLTKEVEPTLLKNMWQKHRFQYFPWTEIRDFRSGEDRDRSFERFKYLTINTRKGGKLEINTKKGDSAAFDEFERVFRHYVEAAAEGSLPDANQPATNRLLEAEAAETIGERAPVGKKHVIREKPDFYKSTGGKVFAIAMLVIFAVLLSAVLLTGNDNPANWFRISFIIIPGMAYVLYRVYGNNEKAERE